MPHEPWMDQKLNEYMSKMYCFILIWFTENVLARMFNLIEFYIELSNQNMNILIHLHLCNIALFRNMKNHSCLIHVEKYVHKSNMCYNIWTCDDSSLWVIELSYFWNWCGFHDCGHPVLSNRVHLVNHAGQR